MFVCQASRKQDGGDSIEIIRKCKASYWTEMSTPSTKVLYLTSDRRMCSHPVCMFVCLFVKQDYAKTIKLISMRWDENQEGFVFVCVCLSVI